MSYLNKLLCPNCGAALRSERGVRIGRKITCLQCAVAFTIRPEDAARAEGAAGVNSRRLSLVLVGALLYLLGSVALAAYCFTHEGRRNKDSEAVTQGEAPTPAPQPPPIRAVRRTTVIVSPEEQRVIDKAIARGVWWLRDHIQASGTWGESVAGAQWPGVGIGFASLPGLTLLECGVPGSDAVVQKAADYVRKQAPTPPGYGNYQRSLAILFLDRLGEARDKELIQYLALCLIAGQALADGGWGYDAPVLQRQRTGELLKLLREDRTTLEQWRDAAVKGIGVPGARSDNSNTQFAVLALWVAQRHGVYIEKTIARVGKRFRSLQKKDGSWWYCDPANTANVSPWANMTCSGLLGLAVSHGLTKGGPKKGEALKDDAIQRALTRLGQEIDRPGEKRGLDLYFLWSLERVGVLYNLPTIAGKDWYAWGRKLILPKQQPDGYWKDGGCWYASNPVIDTCFALLFLKQANLAEDLSDKLGLLSPSE
jgi:hypothetical protein